MGIFDAIGKINSSILGLGGRGGGKGKIKQRVSKLENQVTAMVRSQNQGPTPVEQPIDIQPDAQLGVVPNQIGMNQEESPELLANAPTIASPFAPETQQAIGGMAGSSIPGSFDRDMGNDELV